MSTGEETDRGARWVFGAGALGALVLSIAYLRFRNGFSVGTLEAHAQLGDALGPVVAFLTLLAVVSALWSVQIQRVELALQRKELQETREEMMEQRKQFERTAEAQEALVRSQLALADAQFEAVREAAELRAAQHGSTIATLESALATIEAGAFGAATSTTEKKRTAQALAERRQALSNRINYELQREGHVEALLQSGFLERHRERRDA